MKRHSLDTLGIGCGARGFSKLDICVDLFVSTRMRNTQTFKDKSLRA
jgi:hypothetical protein